MAAVYYEQFNSGYGPGTVLPFVSNPPTKYVTATPCCAQFNPPMSLWETYGRVEADLGFATATLIPSYTKQVNPTATTPIQIFTQVQGNPEIISTYDEFRLASKPESKWIWVAGGNFYRDYNTEARTVTTSTGFVLLKTNSVSSANSWGFFAETTYPITDALRATVGLRYSKEEQAAIQTGVQLGVPQNVDSEAVFTGTNYKARLDYDLRPESLLYFSVATGFRPGGLATIGSGPFGSERLTAYEIGSKNRFLADRLQLNGSAFYYDYPSLQGAFITFAGPVPVGTTVLTNPAAFKGAEIEGLYQVTDDDKISLSVTALDASYTSLSPSALKVFGTTQLANAPRWQASGVYDHRFLLPGGASLTPEVRATYKAQSYIAQSLEAFAIQSGYTLYDFSLNYASADGKYGVTGYVRNLTNEYYKVGGTLNAGAGALSQDVVPGIPRFYGVVLTAHF
jgi:iron complex outermembrane receptor protein